jgi:hypothetical protein
VGFVRRGLRGVRGSSEKPSVLRGDSDDKHVGHVSGSDETGRFKYFRVQVGIMQKIADQNQKAGQMRTNDVPSVVRIPLRTRANAVRYVNTYVIESVFRQYENGDKFAHGRIALRR